MRWAASCGLSLTMRHKKLCILFDSHEPGGFCVENFARVRDAADRLCKMDLFRQVPGACRDHGGDGVWPPGEGFGTRRRTARGVDLGADWGAAKPYGVTVSLKPLTIG